MLFSESGNDTLNQPSWIIDHHEIMEVPGQNINSSLQNLILALRIYVRMSEIQKWVKSDTKFNNEGHLATYFLKSM